MNTPNLEMFLARIYTDPQTRARFLANPLSEAAQAGLTDEQCRALEGIDRVGVQMAARSFAHKRKFKRHGQWHARAVSRLRKIAKELWNTAVERT